jgi:lipopolysaccharide transport system ATP-binding protein
MADTVVRVENLGKRYRIGALLKPARTRREALMRLAGAPFRYLKRTMTRPASEEILWALRNVSFEVERGEVVGIIGRNGAGKSTLLKILSRITEPTEGSAELHGRVGSLLEVGTGFHPELTGRENIYMNGTILGMRRAEIAEKFDEIVAFAEVEKFIDTSVKYYSSGMYVRLAFAVAAHLEPEILIVDEVLAVGDASFQRKCLGKMQNVAQEGRTILFVSHNMAAVQRLCPRALLLEQGQLLLGGDTSTVLSAYYRSTGEREVPVVERRDVPEGAARFVAWQVKSSSKSSYSCFSGEPCAIQLRLRARRIVKEANFGIALWAADGALVWAMRSLDHGGEAVFLREGDYEVEFALPQLPLRPGEYQVLVSVNDLTEGTLDGWYAPPRLQVLPTGDSGLPAQWQGILNLRGKFSLSPLDAQGEGDEDRGPG